MQEQQEKSATQIILDKNISDLQNAIQNFKLEPEFKGNRTITACLAEIDATQETFKQLKTKESHTPDFYSKAIERLAEASDIEAGVQWKTDKGNNTLIRDAREATGFKSNSVYAQLATAFNAARAADRMIRIQDGKIRKDEELSEAEKAKIQQIKDKILEVKGAIQGNPQHQIDLKAVNEFLVSVLKQDERYKTLDDEKLYKQLNATKDIAGLEDKKYNICTIFKQGEKHTVFESEAMIPPLDSDYESIKGDVLAANKKKDPFNADMVEAYWSTLGAQETIPTQNLKTLPGLRNAYVKSCGEITQDKGIVVFGRMMHTGTVASELKTTTPNQIADANVKHMAEMAKVSSKAGNTGIVITTLNTPVGLGSLGGIEQKAYDQLDAAVDAIGDPKIKRALTAMNDMKFTASSKIGAYRDVLDELGRNLEKTKKPEYKAVGEYLQGKGSESAAREEINNPKLDSKQKKILEEAINLKSSVEPTVIGSTWRFVKQIPILGLVLSFIARPLKFLWNVLRGPKMSSSQKRTAGIAALSAMVNKGALGEDIKMPVVSVHCKSGKDRTGAIGIDWSRRLFEAMFGHNQKNLENQVKAGHVGKMAEFGGTPGCIGMKGHAGLSGEMYTKELLDKIGLKTAGNNKISERKLSFLQKLGLSKVPDEIVPGVSKVPEPVSEQKKPKVNQITPEILQNSENIMRSSQLTHTSASDPETKTFTEEVQKGQVRNSIHL